jgi:23S rRNA (cytidine1920-2'-O)/16S rRNA (cytidine1409-2'-O)-methyltransferase
VKKERLDNVVQQRLGVSRAKAQGLISAGSVLDPNGKVLDKPGVKVPDDILLDIREEPRYVSRGGLKLEAALDAFHIDVATVVAIDVGASTGGFTDCLLQRGAARVYAVDVGYGQLAWTLRQDPRVTVIERTNIRNLMPGQLPERPGFFTADCSFISLQLVLPPLKALLAIPADGIVLIKPQFEAGRELVGRGGVVRDAEVHARVVDEVLNAAAQLGFANVGVIPSPLLGPAGNREFLAHLRLGTE